jgi:release factor glutamine methyltransferase
MDTITKIRKDSITKLIIAEIEPNEAQIEADTLIQHTFGLSKIDIFTNPDQKVSKDLLDKFNTLIKKRITEKIPVQYLTHSANFMRHEFYVDTNVLIPRPETEILVQETLKLIRKKQDPNIIDIGTGSGCIACILAILTNSHHCGESKGRRGNPKITASDISEKALEIAKRNAKNLGVIDKIEFIHSDIFANINQTFDIIVSNPPYIPIKEKENLQTEVSRHEPDLALFAEDEKGISFYSKLAEQSASKLNPDGYLAVEFGIFQANYITDILLKYGFSDINVIKDLANIDRIIIAKK